MPQKCDGHTRYTKGCTDCRETMRAYHKAWRMSRRKVVQQMFEPYVEGDTTWMGQAACRATQTEFFPAGGSGVPNRVVYAEAKKVCGGCPVRSDCLDYAMRTDQQFGVWGGLTPGERRDLERRMAS